MASMFNHSPFHGVGSALSQYRREPLTPAPVRLDNFLPPDVQTPVEKPKEYPATLEPRQSLLPRSAAPNWTLAREHSPTLPLFTFPASALETRQDYIPVNIDELSAGLGLPSAKVDASDNVSAAVSHEPRLPQAHPGALYGLAEFLQNQDVRISAEAPARPSDSPIIKTVVQKDTATPKKLSPQSCRVNDTPTPRHVTKPMSTKTTTTPTGPSSHYQHRRGSKSTASSHQDTRVPSHRRFPRRTSRAKRMDQGPMPSAADIYPDDAQFTPSIIHEGHRQTHFQQHQDINQAHESAQPIIANPFDWPPPAQVYAPEQPPTYADILAADTDVLALMNELPEPSLCTLAKLGNTHDLRATSAFGLDNGGLEGDERALTPAQEDGSRYGIRFWGLGYGDQWDLPRIGEFEQCEQFRVRPRDHEGWGGWEWASLKGLRP